MMKNVAIAKYSQLLNKGGKIVFADTIFADQDAYDKTVEAAKQRGFHQLANDRKRNTIHVFQLCRLF